MAQRAVWPDGVVVNAPLLEQDLGLTQTVEDFAVQQFVAEFPNTDMRCLLLSLAGAGGGV